MITSTISVTELLWVLAAVLVAVPCHSWCIHFYRCRLREIATALLVPPPPRPDQSSDEETWADWARAIDARRSQPNLRFLSLVTVGRHVAKLWIQFGFLAAGLFQMTLPPANPAAPVTIGGIVTVSAILNCQLFLSAIAVLEVVSLKWLASHRMVIPLGRWLGWTRGRA